MNRTILECKKLTRSFVKKKETVTILQNIDLKIEENSFVLISGKSGAGKSVLLWLLAGHDRPTRGDVLFNGTSISNASNGKLSHIRREGIGIVYQDFNLITNWTALENVESALLYKSFSKKEKRELSSTMLENMGLGNRLHHTPSELSIGQRQRVALARMLIGEPELILADEPTGGLDPETADEVLSILLDYVRSRKAAMVAVTHGNLSAQISDSTFILHRGMLNKL